MNPPKPFTKSFSLFLAAAMFHASLCCAAGLGAGSIALLEVSLESPGMRAAWDRAAAETLFDPGLLVLGKEDTALALEQWKEEGRVLAMARETAGSSARQQIGSLLEKAWSSYYSFHFEEALSSLDRAEDLLALPGDTASRSRISFESSLLRGMILRARGDRTFAHEFMKAAALDPEAVLAPDRYSPEVVAAYKLARNRLLEKSRSRLSIAGSPAGAEIFLNGENAGTTPEIERDLLPGVHFIEARAPGYEPWSTRLPVREGDHPSLDFALRKDGPSGEPGRFFRGRLEAGDRTYLSELAGRLDVNYVLIPGGGEGTLECLLVGAEGLLLDQAVLWKEGESPDAVTRRMSEFLAPLRFELSGTAGSSLSQVNLPQSPLPSPDAAGEIKDVPAWKRYGPVLLLFVLVGVAAGSGGGGGGTSVEVSW